GRLLVSAGAGLGALGAIIMGAIVLAAGTPLELQGGFLPLTGAALRVDGLSAFFLVGVGVGGLAVAIYGVGYSRAYRRRSARVSVGAMLNVLLLALTVQVMADNVLTFLLAWEVMSLAAYLAVLTDHEMPGTVHAANWYLAVT